MKTDYERRQFGREFLTNDCYLSIRDDINNLIFRSKVIDISRNGARVECHQNLSSVFDLENSGFKAYRIGFQKIKEIDVKIVRKEIGQNPNFLEVGLQFRWLIHSQDYKNILMDFKPAISQQMEYPYNIH